MSESAEAAKSSDEQTLVFRGKLTEDDVVDIQRYRDSLMLRKGMRRFATGLTFGFVIILVIAQILRNEKLTDVTPVVGIGMILAVAYFALVYYPVHRRAQARKNYRKLRDHYHESTVTLSPDSVLIEDVDYRGELRWKLVAVVVDTADGLMFCNSEMAAYFWLPNRLLTAQSRLTALDWARRNNVHVRQL